MENEVKEVILDEELGNEVVAKVDRKTPKLVILGGITAVAALLFKFRNKINAKIEGNMVKKLTKRGYVVNSPAELKEIEEEIFEKLS